VAKGPVGLDERMGVLGVAGERGVAPMLASGGVDFALMGVAALELLRLEVDPAAGKLEESVAHLLWSGRRARLPSGGRAAPLPRSCSQGLSARSARWHREHGAGLAAARGGCGEGRGEG
jgi:hypothetical protein